MGNVCSFSFSCDDTISHCLDCTVRKAGYICELQDNLTVLQRELKKLIEKRDDVKIRVLLAEQKLMKPLEQVQGWLSRVQHVETEAGELAQINQQEVQQRRLTAFCSRNCMSNYKLGKKVLKTLEEVKNLISEGDFKDVAHTAPQNPFDGRPIPPGITVGLQLTLEKVWRCITEEQAGIIGIYGMGGVGKTTLLAQINNKFLNTPNSFNVVIWTVVSKDLEIEKIQDSIAKRFDLFNDSWRSKNQEGKAQEIFKLLDKKKFALLLDDIWEEVDLIRVGLPVPSSTYGSKVIFTTRKFEVCGKMNSDKDFKVECLRSQDAWRLFEKNIGRKILDSHPNIFKLAEAVVKECGGLPLALITVGRAMANRETPQEWEHAIEVLKTSGAKFSDIETKVYSCLKFSYDFLNSTDRFCLLYCSLFPEDFKIDKEQLIDCWICEGFLGEDDGIEARNRGHFIIGTLLNACLLEEEDTFVKMHDVIRDMALWVTSTIGKEKEKFLVHAGVGLNQPPRIGMWEEVTRMSLMNNKIENLSESPSCPRLQTLFLEGNSLEMIGSDFFQSMTSLCVLNLSRNCHMQYLPAGISCLVSLQHLNLSHTPIQKLPEELKDLVNLKCLNLEYTDFLRTISRHFICNLKMLQVLRMYRCGAWVQKEDSVLFGSSERLVEELLGLEYLNVLTIDLRTFHALQRLLSSPRLLSSTRSIQLKDLKDSKSLNVLSLASLRHLERLQLWSCEELEELKIEYTGELKKIPETHSFHYLQYVNILYCSKLKHVTWLIFAPNIQTIRIEWCRNMEAIIKLNEVPAEVVKNLIPFARLQFLTLIGLNSLKSIYPNALQFPRLKEMNVFDCPNLKKLPLDCNNTSERKFIIKGTEY